METKVCKCCGKTKPIGEFKRTGKGLMNTCTDCWIKHIKESQAKNSEIEKLRKELSEARTARLDTFTPRELMVHLANLGYQGVLTYTKIEKVDITKL